MEENDLESAVLIDEMNLSNYENKNQWEFLIGRNTNYRFYAYPGPDVTKEGRIEHLPYHVHIYSPNIKNLRVNLENLESMDDGKFIPRNLKRYLKDNQKELTERTKDIFHTGKLRDSYD
jgi:hypothetical protein